ncbi:MAG: macro domain-containing protein, partial [Lachnospiraceae bacterium]|nr:macro domain-containing protein [Lachnospiraceae bacterium]
IAFPGISTGIYGYPLDEAARVALDAIAAWMDAHPDVEMKITLCCFREVEMEPYEKLGLKAR